MSERPPERVVIRGVEPELEGGRFAIKRSVGETVNVEADIFADGHDSIAAVLRYRHEDDEHWLEIAMEPLGNDRWRASFRTEKPGQYIYTLSAWVDSFQTWYTDFLKRVAAQQDVTIDLQIGTGLLKSAAGRANGPDAQKLREVAAQLRPEAVDDRLAKLACAHADRSNATHHRELRVTVDTVRARFSTWYEMFPRSSGTLRDCTGLLPEIAQMGFDILYFPPLDPIGQTHRKGKNNATTAEPGEPGSPWAIGGKEGGHKAIHPDLGNLDDFRRLVGEARRLGIDIALDIAFQCAPDHPYVREHPEWFRRRPDGTVQYAENPPKKYQDIYPFDFENADWRALWEELLDVFLFWIGEGVRIFRVDNPHTKPFAFWEWAIAEVRRRHPDAIFLSEAFTQPRVKHRLAKLGFSQSYTYFAWRNTKHELVEYFTELAHGPGRDYFRPNAWPNTPDILTEYLQYGGRPAFAARLVLAATLAASYGIYGPAFELAERTPREPGTEEYLDSEKYQLREWDLERADSLAGLIERVNRVRRDNPALQADDSLQFFPVDNDQLICYAKQTADRENVVVCVVNLDPHHAQSGWVALDLPALGLDPATPYQMHELLTGARYLWSGPRNYVSLDPQRAPAHLFRLRRRVRSERDFDYFM